MANHEKPKGAVSNIQKLSQLGRRRAGAEDGPRSSDAELIASIYLQGENAAPAEASAHAAGDQPYAVPGEREPASSSEDPAAPVAPDPERATAPVAETVPGQAESAPEDARLPRPSKKAMIAAVVVLVVTAAAFARSCGSASDTKTTETKPAAPTVTWMPIEPREVKPLDSILPGPETAVGIEREKQIPKLLESLNKPDKPATAEPAPVDKPVTVNTDRTVELEVKVASLTKELETLRAAQTRKAPAKRAAAPTVRILGIARTAQCRSCPLFALLDVDGKTLQVTSGDKVKDYTVAVSDDRVVLARGKENLTFYSLTAP